MRRKRARPAGDTSIEQHLGPIVKLGQYAICKACWRCWALRGTSTIPRCAPRAPQTVYYG
jgi:hypothetical protein